MSGNLAVCCCDKTSIRMFSACSIAFCRASAEKTPQPSVPSPSLTKLGDTAGQRQELDTPERFKRNDLPFKHKECVMLEQTEQIQIKSVRNETNKESKPTKLDLAVGEVLW